MKFKKTIFILLFIALLIIILTLTKYFYHNMESRNLGNQNDTSLNCNLIQDSVSDQSIPKTIRINKFRVYSQNELTNFTQNILPQITNKNDFIKFYFKNLECGNKSIIKSLSYPTVSNQIDEKSWDFAFDIFWQNYGGKKIDMLIIDGESTVSIGGKNYYYNIENPNSYYDDTNHYTIQAGFDEYPRPISIDKK